MVEAWGGHEAMVQLLLRREDVNPETFHYLLQSWTALTFAAKSGNGAGVRILLERNNVRCR
jgi:ankyrin repeat protein